MDLTRYILTKHSEDMLFLLSEHLSEDPLENFFGKQRAREARNDNQTVQCTLQNARVLRIQKSLALDPVRGNSSWKCHLFVESDKIDDIDNAPLPKRRCQTKISS